MKEFNLEEAKSGKPVCTRDGKDVRIVSFKGIGIYPIISIMVTNLGEEILTNTLKGQFCPFDKNGSNYDLMMK